MTDARPLLFFDSGVGGLSVLQPTRLALPRAPIVYVADSAGFPYGTRSEAEIAERVPRLIGDLVARYDPRLVVIACNTASTVALDHVRAALDVPVVGTVPAIKPAALISRSRVIGVLGTEATVRQAYVDNLSAAFASDCTILRHGSPRLVELAEAKLHGRDGDPADYARELDGLIQQPHGERMDTVVLACTHFPLVQVELAAAAPQPMTFVHGGRGIARRIASLLQDQRWPEKPAPGLAIFTGADDVAALLPALVQYGLTRVEHA